MDKKTAEYLNLMLRRKLWSSAYQCSRLLHQIIEHNYQLALLEADRSGIQADLAATRKAVLDSPDPKRPDDRRQQ